MRSQIIKTYLSRFSVRYIIYLTSYIWKKYFTSKISMGAHSYGNPKVVYYGGNNKVIVGKFCSIAPKVTFLLIPSHNTKLFSTFPFSAFFYKNITNQKITTHVVDKGNIIVGNDVWIGYGCYIYPGVKIGDGAVIAANSVVTNNVYPYSIVGGNPAKLIKFRFDKKIISSLLKIRWWNWPLNKVEDNMCILTSNNISGLEKIIKKENH